MALSFTRIGFCFGLMALPAVAMAVPLCDAIGTLVRDMQAVEGAGGYTLDAEASGESMKVYIPPVRALPDGITSRSACDVVVHNDGERVVACEYRLHDVDEGALQVRAGKLRDAGLNCMKQWAAGWRLADVQGTSYGAKARLDSGQSLSLAVSSVRAGAHGAKLKLRITIKGR